jgi:hypothetical protein
MQYISQNRRYGVLYVGLSRPGVSAGTYDVVEVIGGEGSATWPVVRNWDWFKDARIDADEFDRQAEQA